jgi:hypothetical protein
MNRIQVQFVALVGAATLAASALGQTSDHVACDGSSTAVRLSNRANILLNQNSPNPFADQTTISYKLPDKMKKAQLIFHDAQGKLIKAVDITSRGGRSNARGDDDAECTGIGRVIVFADDLAHGSYTYALVVDGRVVGSKTMVTSE